MARTRSAQKRTRSAMGGLRAVASVRLQGAPEPFLEADPRPEAQLAARPDDARLGMADVAGPGGEELGLGPDVQETAHGLEQRKEGVALAAGHVEGLPVSAPRRAGRQVRLDDVVDVGEIAA